ncbi:hypothetical protein CerSpe_090750 [Prunus speciosa]
MALAHDHSNMRSGGHRSKALMRKKSIPAGKSLLLQHDLDHQVVLSITIYRADGVDDPSSSTICASDRIYRALVWVEPGKEYRTPFVRALPDPRWEGKCEIPLRTSVLGWGHLNVEVLRGSNDSEPGTSNGIASVSRARIPLPRKMNEQKEGRFGLVRNEGAGLVKAEGHIILSMKVKER